MSEIESNYSINITKLGQRRFDDVTIEARKRYFHFVKLEIGNCLEREALAMLADTIARYPAPEFQVDMTYWTCSGRRVELKLEQGK